MEKCITSLKIDKLCPCIGRFNKVRMVIVPQIMYNFSAIPIKTLRFPIKLARVILKFCGRIKVQKIAYTILKTNNKKGMLGLLDTSLLKAE